MNLWFKNNLIPVQNYFVYLIVNLLCSSKIYSGGSNDMVFRQQMQELVNVSCGIVMEKYHNAV